MLRPTAMRRSRSYVVYYHTWVWGFLTGASYKTTKIQKNTKIQKKYTNIKIQKYTWVWGFLTGDSYKNTKIQKYKKIHKNKNTKIHLGLGIPHKWSNSILLSSMFSIPYPTFLDVSMGSKWMMHLILWLSSFKFQLQASFQWLGWST